MPGPTGRKLTRSRIVTLIKYAQMRPFTAKQLAKFMGMSRTSAYDWLREMHEAGIVYIHAYVPTLRNGDRAKVFAWGSNADAEKPPAKTSAERVAKVRDKSTLERAWRTMGRKG